MCQVRDKTHLACESWHRDIRNLFTSLGIRQYLCPIKYAEFVLGSSSISFDRYNTERSFMDRREIKTKRSIKNAFLKLRSKKEIEQITIRELAEEAEISKATFYLHYRDIYDLSDTLGNEIIENLVKGISNPDNIIEDPAAFTRELAFAFLAQKNIIDILFSGSREYKLADQIEQSIRTLVFHIHPEYIGDISFHLKLSYRVKGIYYAFRDNLNKFEPGILIEELCRISDNK